MPELFPTMGNRAPSKLGKALIDNNTEAAKKIYDENEKSIKPFEVISNNKRDTFYGTTLLHCAALGANYRFLKLFLESNRKNMSSHAVLVNLAHESILHCACGGGSEKEETEDRLACVKYLLSCLRRRDDINIQDQSGRTALHHAARRGRKEIVNMLLSAGADERILNKSSWTAADEAQEGGSIAIASHIESKTIFAVPVDKTAKVKAATHESLRHLEGNGLILQDVRSEKDSALIEMSTMLGIDLWTSEALLRYFKWNKGLAANQFLSNPKNACRLAGVSITKNLPSKIGVEESSCLICGITPNERSYQNDVQVKACGVWYQDEWIEDVNFLKAIQLSCRKPIEKMGVQRLINNLASQVFQAKEQLNNAENTLQVAESKPKIPTEHCSTVGSMAMMSSTSELDLIDLPTCGHTFCKLCWSKYLRLKIKRGNMKIDCPKDSCHHLVPIDIIQKLVSYEVGKKYLYFDLKSFVESNDCIEWCPRPSCEFAVSKAEEHLPSVKSKNGLFRLNRNIFFNAATCLCEHRFCFKCKVSPPHDPASCKMMEDWKLLIDKYIGMENHNRTVAGNGDEGTKDLATEAWIRANTKPCPKCRILIQKNDGCNHMTCKHCSHEFCWICMGPWKQHGNNTGGYFRCNIYKGTGATTNKEDKRQSDAKARDVEKFLVFYTQSVAHQNSLYLEQPLLASAESRMIDIIQSTDQSDTDVTFVNFGFFVLLKSRSLLKACWIWAYFEAPFLSSDSRKDVSHGRKSSRSRRKKLEAELLSAINELTTATEKLSDKIARRRFRHQRSNIVNAINDSYAALDRLYRLLLGV